ncbi:MAG: MATE family efflux transporter [Lachnospiraceae bacterium]|jgi:putative MATE family efflux protein
MVHDMTEGRITPMLIRFTIPLVLGNVFQLLYNATDSIIVGKFVGEEALAAVGTSNPIMTLAILFITGMCIGAGILMGMYYGRKDIATLKRQISSSMIGGLIFSACFALVCILFAPQLLRLIQTQEAVMDEAVVYLRIVLAGLIFTFIYNFFANTMRALGDANTPLLFLVISAALNVAGDLIFVIVFRLGSVGCAVATVVSEALSALFCVVYVSRRIPMLDLGREWFVFDRTLFKKTVAFGLTSALQQATVQIGKIAIQALANSMSVMVMATFAAVNRIDDFAYTPQQNIGHAMSSFMAQNEGAGKKDRVKKGFLAGMRIEAVYGIAIALVCFFLAEPLMKLFIDDQDVIDTGVRYLKLISFMYILPAMTNGVQGFFRGIGDMKVTLISSSVNMIGRVAAGYFLVWGAGMEIEAFPWAYLIGWVAMLAAEVPLLVKKFRGTSSGKQEMMTNE